MNAETHALVEGHAPLCIHNRGAQGSLAEIMSTHAQALSAQLDKHGAILFRGFRVAEAESFSNFVTATGGQMIDYSLQSTPRTRVSGQIYTSTEYPANREIPLHCENAYHTTWPRRLAFCCVTPSAQGGETPIADLRDVSRALGDELMDRFERLGVRYLRHFHEGIDLSWRQVFQTTDAREVARICRANDIEYDWIGANRKLLRTVQTCQGVVYHPVTSERMFFNQAHLFHVTSMGPVVAGHLREEFGEDQLPRHAKYGDGTEIDDAIVEHISGVFRKHAITFRWERGDVLWIDNMRFAHGRRPYAGSRRILAALMDSYGATARVPH